MRGVEEVGEEETNDLEGHTDHAVPDEAEEGADWEAIDVDFIGRGEAGGKDGCSFPVGRCGVCGSGLV